MTMTVCEGEVTRLLGLWTLEQLPQELLRRAQALPAPQRVVRLAEIYGVDRSRIEAVLTNLSGLPRVEGLHVALRPDLD